MAGPDLRDPLSLSDDPAVFADLAALDGGRRIAWTEDLGFLPVAREIRTAFGAARRQFVDLGCVVEETAPNLQDAPEVFQVLRAHGFAAQFGGFYETDRDKLKDTVQWNTARGLEQSGPEVAKAELAQTDIYRRMVGFFQDYDFLVLPTTQVLPFSKALDWVREIDGIEFDNYLQWMEICTVISVTGCPSISVPCGFSDDGLPVGLQIVGPPRADLTVQINGASSREPDIVR